VTGRELVRASNRTTLARSSVGGPDSSAGELVFLVKRSVETGWKVELRPIEAHHGDPTAVMLPVASD